MQLRGVVEALCEARDEGRREPEEARTTFFDRAHDSLPDLAAASGEDAPSSAARLLEAKQASKRISKRWARPSSRQTWDG